MYLTHWGLSEPPFASCPDARRFYRSPIHDEALARLHFLVEDRRRLGLLLGPPGTGKSLLLQVFEHEARRSGAMVLRTSLYGRGTDELLSEIATGLSSASTTGSSDSIWRGIRDRLLESRFQQLPVVLLFDDGDRTDRGVHDQVCRLIKTADHPDARLTVVMALAAKRTGRLSPDLLELAELRVDLDAWEASDTAGYIEQALARSGRREPIFTSAALDALHDLAGGAPRRVNQVAQCALLAGAGSGVARIEPELVEAAARELAAVEI